jgi:hypothetical protein
LWCVRPREPKAERGKSYASVWLIHVSTFFTLFTADEDASSLNPPPSVGSHLCRHHLTPAHEHACPSSPPTCPAKITFSAHMCPSARVNSLHQSIRACRCVRELCDNECSGASVCLRLSAVARTKKLIRVMANSGCTGPFCLIKGKKRSCDARTLAGLAELGKITRGTGASREPRARLVTTRHHVTDTVQWGGFV